MIFSIPTLSYKSNLFQTLVILVKLLKNKYRASFTKLIFMTYSLKNTNLECLLKMEILRPHSQLFWFSVSGWGPGICISAGTVGDSEAGTRSSDTLWETGIRDRRLKTEWESYTECEVRVHWLLRSLTASEIPWLYFSQHFLILRGRSLLSIDIPVVTGIVQGARGFVARVLGSTVTSGLWCLLAEGLGACMLLQNKLLLSYMQKDILIFTT